MTVAPALLDAMALVAAVELPFVLRGGLVMRLHFGPVARRVEDVDFLSDAPIADVEVVLRAAFGARLRSEERIWEETEFPGLRYVLDMNGSAVQLDVGFGDPRAQPDRRFVYPGTSVEVVAVAPETLYAWKVHGLVERGVGKWRPKDLFDLDVLALHGGLDFEQVVPCLSLAFASRGDSFSLLDRFLDPEGGWGRSRGSRRKWERFERSRVGVPSFETVVTRVRGRLGPLVSAAR
ncbi:MAG: nucleotidyl transferase AbiEii/AbiGii toxin family protein [Sandaracinus sp.]|nr:nucleotidyl transferase AbiEii/AbiGii toxin family protein [Sandaracinus sp.]MCB9619149.1 nucleotidyl transferase AbiEii/AbiGii toxin family protein [Sandaracinus sp.]MCB9632732.1 nucleotidyl transferase AbiEii/AbiGii toxin family protein [Sandaracinus sp.]